MHWPLKIQERLDHKDILIWGYGAEGKSTEEFLKRYCTKARVSVFEGAAEEIDFASYDYVIKSPGIFYPNEDDRIVSQTTLFLEEFRDQVIGVTGTKGKSTTSSLLAHTLRMCGKDVILVGNIGLPCLSKYDEVGPDTIIVFEMSCHQLFEIEVSPHISVYLNLYEDHLDYYKTIDRYHGAKQNIALHQTEQDYFFVGENVPTITTRSFVKEMPYAPENVYELTSLQGVHNQYNASIVKAIATGIYGIQTDKVWEAINSFRGLPHRLEPLGEIDGITYYDDSISTICQSAIQATQSIELAGSVLIGGMDRGIDYADLISFMKEKEDVEFICMYESGKRIYKELDSLKHCHYVEDLPHAVELAKEITPKGKACILSPAAASYGYFKNFEHRGNCFQELAGF